MGKNFRPFPTKCGEMFLIEIGQSHKRTKGSHDQCSKPNYRTIPVWGDEKEIPAFHLKSSCKSMGKTLDDLYLWADANC